MIEYFAGRYLLNNQIITRDKLNELLVWLKVASTDFTEISTDLIAGNQSALIRMLQNSLDEKLGDLAGQYSGYSSEQTSHMIKKQNTLNAAFFNQLILTGVLTQDNLTEHLVKLRAYYALNQPDFSRNLKEDFDLILTSFFQTEDYLASEYAKIALKYVLRFVGTGLRFGECKRVFSFSAERIAVQKLITAQGRFFIAIGGEKSAMQRFNDGIQHSFTADDRPLRYKSLLPFVNSITNIFQTLVQSDRIKFIDETNIYKYSTVFISEHCSLLDLRLADTQLFLAVGHGLHPNFATITHNL